jgi:ubiquinone/menaquinone biosynthesis C-methylase UbiE
MGNAMNKKSGKLYDYIFSNLHMADNERVLEIGFGNGRHFSRYFDINRNVEVFGADISDLMIAHAKRINTQLMQAGKLTLVKSDIEDLAFEKAFFDKVVTVNTVYFWKDPVKGASEIHRVLKYGVGTVLIVLRTRETLQRVPVAKYNFSLYEYDEIESFLKLVGFNNISFDKVPSDIKSHNSICIRAHK